MNKPSRLHAVLVGGLIAGTLDILFALTYAAVNGVGPLRLLQTVASGLLGDADLMFKLQPGEANNYPSDTLHQVVPVTRGERLVAITFIQSRIQDPFERSMLFELNEVAALEGLKMDQQNFGRLQLVQVT